MDASIEGCRGGWMDGWMSNLSQDQVKTNGCENA